MKNNLWTVGTLIAAVLLMAGILAYLSGMFSNPVQALESSALRIEFDQRLHSRIVARSESGESLVGPFSPSEYVTIGGQDIKDFSSLELRRGEMQGVAGKGQRLYVVGETPQNNPTRLRKEVAASIHDDFPRMVLLEVSYTNTGRSAVKIDRWTNHHYRIDRHGSDQPAFWSFQSGSYESRPDWILPLKPGFRQENFLGMNSTDYGGGTPVVDVWSRGGGVAVGHVEMAPREVSLPVAMPDKHHASVAVTYNAGVLLPPGETLKTLRTFVAVHRGDYFQALADYRSFMTTQGLELPQAPAPAFEPIWCAWGYGRDFRPEQIYSTLPVVKKLAFQWVTLDDGWQTAEGDWYIDKKKFPGGERDLRAMVDRIHAEGFKAQLWWAPLAVDPGTDLIRGHPEQLLLSKDGSRQKITWWDAFYLCPAEHAVRDDARRFTTKALRDWGFDGLKIDGQHLNGAPPCYNPAHRHARPEESVEGVPGFFQAIYEAAIAAKPEALIEICPCGTAYSFFTLPYLNMAVASDPKSSWQVRTKGKTLKALMGDGLAYFGDHVEMTDGGDDFASTVGVGGVVGTNFTWPPGAGKEKKLELTAEKEAHWEHWLEIYRQKMLSRGEYIGTLYDIGFDRPEAHAIRKDGRLYYAFFAANWRGPVELRGLDSKSYRVTDYVTGRDLGTVKGPVARLDVAFERNLLLEVAP